MMLNVYDQAFRSSSSSLVVWKRANRKIGERLKKKKKQAEFSLSFFLTATSKVEMEMEMGKRFAGVCVCVCMFSQSVSHFSVIFSIIHCF